MNRSFSMILMRNRSNPGRWPMQLALVQTAEAREWLYPDAFPNAKHNVSLVLPEPSKLHDLWRSINSTSGQEEVFVSYFPTSAKTGRRLDDESLVQLNPRFLSDLASLPPHSRWLHSREWAIARLNRTPNRSEEAWHKQALTTLCHLAERAQATQSLLVVIQE